MSIENSVISRTNLICYVSLSLSIFISEVARKKLGKSLTCFKSHEIGVLEIMVLMPCFISQVHFSLIDKVQLETAKYSCPAQKKILRKKYVHMKGNSGTLNTF